MVAESPRTRQLKRLRAVDAANRKTLKALHDDYNKAYDAALRKHNLTITKLADHFSFSPEFHADVAEAKRAFLAGHALAHEAKKSSVATLPRR